MTILTKMETRHLLDAAGQGGEFTLPGTWKPVSRERLIGRLLRDGLLAATETGHRLTPAGYRAIGLRPRRTSSARVAGTGDAQPSNKDRVVELLRRDDGASIAELIEATGWLPHTTRAALSRLRSAGEPVLRSTRDDVTVYRIVSASVPLAAREPIEHEAEAAA